MSTTQHSFLIEHSDKNDNRTRKNKLLTAIKQILSNFKGRGNGYTPLQEIIDDAKYGSYTYTLYSQPTETERSEA